MGDVVNLRRARKARKRADESREAEANRVAYGRSKSERALSEREKALAAQRLDGHRLGTDRDET